MDIHVGARMRMRRLMLEMTQEKLAGALQLTFQQVQKYEKGTNRIGAGRLHRIADVLGVPVAFFYEGAAGNGEHAVDDEVTALAAFLATADGLALNKLAAQLDREMLRSVVNLLEAIVEESA
jgi:transcriptional regulator with XRE-family HTH domain